MTHNFGNSLDKEQQAEAIEAGKKLTGKETVYEATGKSATTGLSGTYALYGDATRELAAELKLEPRQLQSVVWTTKRTSFGDPSPADKEYATVLGWTTPEAWRRCRRPRTRSSLG